MMQSPEEVARILGAYVPAVEGELRKILRRKPRFFMYDMMRYFFGFADKYGVSMRAYGGKRFRSALCLLIADYYNAADRAVHAASAIELFHNFTLIHDDIVDKDELRRGRPTVWALWGVDHAINTGDAQFILAMQAAAGGDPAVQKFLHQQFLAVVEGQYLDFELSKEKIGSKNSAQSRYYEMIKRKTAALIAAAAQAAGMVSGCTEKEQNMLWRYGYNLGIAYQLCDDAVSLWGDKKTTGKTERNDLYEKKKTLPVLRAFSILPLQKKRVFARLFNKNTPITKNDAAVLFSFISQGDAYEYTRAQIDRYAERAKKAAYALALSAPQKDVLCAVVDALLPRIDK